MFKLSQFKSRGTALIEMAIILPIFIYLLFAMLFLGISIYDNNTLENIVRQMTRYASVQLAADPVLNSASNQYEMVNANRSEVEEKLQRDIEKQCSEKLIFYKHKSSVVEYPRDLLGNEALKDGPNEKVSVAITVEADDTLSSMTLGIVPLNMTKRLVMRIEDHYMIVEN